MNDNWYKDIMIQRFQLDTYYDPTKLFLALSLTETGVLKEKYKIDDICRYIRRLYVANPDVAKANVNVSIRNVTKYGISDLKPTVLMSIRMWEKEQQFNSISHDDHFLYLTVDMSEVDYISSVGLRALLSFQKQLSSKGEVKIVNIKPEVLEIFKMVGFDKVLNLE